MINPGLRWRFGHGVGPQRGLQGRSGSRRRIECGKEAVEPKGRLTGLIPERAGQAAVSCLGIGIPRINRNRFADLQDFENSRPINFRFVPT